MMQYVLSASRPHGLESALSAHKSLRSEALSEVEEEGLQRGLGKLWDLEESLPEDLGTPQTNPNDSKTLLN